MPKYSGNDPEWQYYFSSYSGRFTFRETRGITQKSVLHEHRNIILRYIPKFQFSETQLVYVRIIESLFYFKCLQISYLSLNSFIARLLSTAQGERAQTNHQTFCRPSNTQAITLASGPVCPYSDRTNVENMIKKNYLAGSTTLKTACFPIEQLLRAQMLPSFG